MMKAVTYWTPTIKGSIWDVDFLVYFTEIPSVCIHDSIVVERSHNVCGSSVGVDDFVEKLWFDQLTCFMYLITICITQNNSCFVPTDSIQ